MIDVHILHSESDNLEWARECDDSLASHPIVLHHLPAIPGDITKARAAGFNQGHCKYVSYVDPDDIVLPGAFDSCLLLLENNPLACGVYTYEVMIGGDGKIIGEGWGTGSNWNPCSPNTYWYIHHVSVMRRELVEKYLPELSDDGGMQPEFRLKALLSIEGPWLCSRQCGYQWRRYPGQFSDKIQIKEDTGALLSWLQTRVISRQVAA